MAGRVVYDSDEDSDLGPPPRSPVHPVHGIMDRPATPPRAMVAHMEPSPLPDTLSVTHPVATSSTDPSFFQNVYQEQQRELGAQLNTEHDLWDVPSSPMRPPPAMQPSDSAKRKREAEMRGRNTNSSSGSGGGSGNAPPKRQRQEGDATRPVMSNGLEISIPLEPITPNMLHQYPRLLSSSGDQSFPGEVTHTLGHALAAHHHHEYQQPPGDAVTQSTVAFATPSIYASSGRRGLGSNNASDGNDAGRHDMAGEHKSSFDGLEAVEEVATVNASTPPRKARAAAIQQVGLIMSSPDIIAGPAPQAEPESEPRWHPIAPVEAPREDGGAEDELRINTLPFVRDEIDESDGSELSFHSSPGREPVPTPSPARKKAKKIIILKRPTVIAASDDEDFDSGGADDLAGAGGYHDVPCLPASDTDSDFSAKVSKKSKTATPKAKKGRTKKDTAVVEAPPTKSNTVIRIELPDQAPIAEQPPPPPPPKGKRPRGRPKQVPKKEYKDSDDELDHGLSDVEAERLQLPPLKPAAKPAAKPTTKTTAKPKGKNGRGKKAKANSKVETIDDGDEPSASITALGEASGNAVSANPIRIPEKQEAGKLVPEAEEDKAASAAPNIGTPAAEEKKPVPPAVKPSASGLTTGLGIGLGATGQARVLYRVGLSKKTRIAPLLKIVRK